MAVNSVDDDSDGDSSGNRVSTSNGGATTTTTATTTTGSTSTTTSTTTSTSTVRGTAVAAKGDIEGGYLSPGDGTVGCTSGGSTSGGSASGDSPSGLRVLVTAVPISGGFESTSNASQTSYFNEAEAEVVTRVLEVLVSKGQVSLTDIGVITPYNAQVHRW